MSFIKNLLNTQDKFILQQQLNHQNIPSLVALYMMLEQRRGLNTGHPDQEEYAKLQEEVQKELIKRLKEQKPEQINALTLIDYQQIITCLDLLSLKTEQQVHKQELAPLLAQYQQKVMPRAFQLPATSTGFEVAMSGAMAIYDTTSRTYFIDYANDAQRNRLEQILHANGVNFHMDTTPTPHVVCHCHVDEDRSMVWNMLQHFKLFRSVFPRPMSGMYWIGESNGTIEISFQNYQQREEMEFLLKLNGVACHILHPRNNQEAGVISFSRTIHTANILQNGGIFQPTPMNTDRRDISWIGDDGVRSRLSCLSQDQSLAIQGLLRANGIPYTLEPARSGYQEFERIILQNTAMNSYIFSYLGVFRPLPANIPQPVMSQVFLNDRRILLASSAVQYKYIDALLKQNGIYAMQEQSTGGLVIPDSELAAKVLQFLRVVQHPKFPPPPVNLSQVQVSQVNQNIQITIQNQSQLLYIKAYLDTNGIAASFMPIVQLPNQSPQYGVLSLPASELAVKILHATLRIPYPAAKAVSGLGNSEFKETDVPEGFATQVQVFISPSNHFEAKCSTKAQQQYVRQLIKKYFPNVTASDYESAFNGFYRVKLLNAPDNYQEIATKMKGFLDYAQGLSSSATKQATSVVTDLNYQQYYDKQMGFIGRYLGNNLNLDEQSRAQKVQNNLAKQRAYFTDEFLTVSEGNELQTTRMGYYPVGLKPPAHLPFAPDAKAAESYRHLTHHRLIYGPVSFYLDKQFNKPTEIPLITACAINLYSSPKEADIYISADKGTQLFNQEAYAAECRKLADFIVGVAKSNGHSKLVMPAFGVGVYVAKLNDEFKLKARELMYKAFADAAQKHRINVDWIIWSRDKKCSEIETELKRYSNSFMTPVVHADMLQYGRDLLDKGGNVVLLNPGSDRTVGGQFTTNKGDFSKLPVEEQMTQQSDLVLLHTEYNTAMAQQFKADLVARRKAHPASPLKIDAETKTKEVQAKLKAGVQSLHHSVIQNAFAEAVRKYKDWYQTGNNKRGQQGLFTWARHGNDGQILADNELVKVKGAANDSDAIAIINELLTKSTTRYHRHSLASFILDELVKIKASPWDGLKTNESNHYRQSEVVRQVMRAMSQQEHNSL